MRTFSEFEMEFVRNLVKDLKGLKSEYPKDNLYKILLEEYIVFSASDGNGPCLFFYYKQDELISEEMSKKYERFYGFFLQIALLMIYLKENGLIYLLNNGEEKLEYPPLDKDDGYIRKRYQEEKRVKVRHNLDMVISNYFLECINNSVYISQTLIDLVNNDFKSIEEQNLDEAKKQTKSAQRTYRISVATLMVALGTMIITIVLGKCSVTLDENQELFKHPIEVVDSTFIKRALEHVNSNKNDAHPSANIQQKLEK